MSTVNLTLDISMSKTGLFAIFVNQKLHEGVKF